MAVYTVIQDVEAEDKLLGPLSLKGFIYAVIAGVSAFIEVRTLIAGSLGPIRWVIMLAFLGPMLLFGVLASPLGREQPTEVWLLSRIKFFLKARQRVWDQSGAKNLVTITVPKKVEHQLVKDLSQTEVKSRLQALASTLDSRGWAVRNAAVDSTTPTYLESSEAESDRLVAPSGLPQNAPVLDVHAADDIMDEQNNPTAQNFANLMQQADVNRKKDIIDKLNAVRASDTTFLDQQALPAQTGQTTFVGSNVVAPATDDDKYNNFSKQEPVSTEEKQLLERIHKEQAELESKLPKHFHAKVNQSVDNRPAAAAPPTPIASAPIAPPPIPVTPEIQAAKLELAQSGNDLSVASIAQIVNHKNQMQQIGPNEFVIDLH